MRPLVRRTGAVAALTLSGLLITAPAALAITDKGPGAGAPGLSTGRWLLYFAVVPLAIALAITVLVVAPTLFRGPRYRPGRPWNYAPVWFGGPQDPADPLPAADPSSAKGGASGSW